jgi:hypothetical protein
MFLIDRDCALPRVAPRPRPETWPLASPAWRAGTPPSHDWKLIHGSRPGQVNGRLGLLRQASCDDSGFIGRNRQNLQLSYFNPAMRIPPGCCHCQHNLIVANTLINPRSGTGRMFRCAKEERGYPRQP